MADDHHTQNCTLCPDGNPPGNPNLALPSPPAPANLTCEGLDLTVFQVIQNSTVCAETKNNLFANGNPYAYCGCGTSNSTAPPIASPCDFCANRTIDMTAKIPLLGAVNISTCAEAANVIPSLGSGLKCSVALHLLEPICCPETLGNQTGTNQSICGICGLNTPVGSPDKVLPILKHSCGILDMGLGFTPPGECSAAVAALSSTFDIQAFCGCPGASPPDLCQFCNVSDMPFPDFPLGNETCRDFAALAPYLTDQTLCDSQYTNLHAGCCPTGNQTCSVCANNTAIPDPQRPLHLAPYTCGELNFLLGFFQQCPSSTEYGIDFSGWCGCPGTSASDLCPLCPSGESITHPSMIVPETTINVTCEQAAQIAVFVNNETVCSTDVALASKFCCGANSSATPMPSSVSATTPTPATTPAPVTPATTPAPTTPATTPAPVALTTTPAPVAKPSSSPVKVTPAPISNVVAPVAKPTSSANGLGLGLLALINFLFCALA